MVLTIGEKEYDVLNASEFMVKNGEVISNSITFFLDPKEIITREDVLNFPTSFSLTEDELEYNFEDFAFESYNKYYGINSGNVSLKFDKIWKNIKNII